MSSQSALLWLTHVWSPELQVEFEKLYNMQGPETPDVWLLLDERTTGATELREKYQRCHVFEEQNLFRLPYPKLEGRGLICQTHLPVLDFYLSHPNYKMYWIIEYDVRYTGTWESLLRSFQSFDHDLITCHIRRFDQEPYWSWWNTLHHPTKTIKRENYLRSFNVIYRISHAALEFIHQAQGDGWRGFSEVSFPTLLFNSGFKLLDFGGNSEFTPPRFRNRFYTSHGFRNGGLMIFGTMRYRPSRARVGTLKNKIYHPVKPKSMVEPCISKVIISAQSAFNLIYNLVRR